MLNEHSRLITRVTSCFDYSLFQIQRLSKKEDKTNKLNVIEQIQKNVALVNLEQEISLMYEFIIRKVFFIRM